jgi:hypothetical protein
MALGPGIFEDLPQGLGGFAQPPSRRGRITLYW